MQVVKKESEELVQAIRETLRDLKGAYDKLRYVVEEKMLQTAAATEAIMCATDNIECAAAFLTMEQGEESYMLPRATPPETAWETVRGQQTILQFEYERFTNF